MIDFESSVNRAMDQIRPHLRETPLEPSLHLSDCGMKVYAKCENLQYTGSFKARGAMNKLLCLAPEESERGVVAASTGNHGAAVAFGAAKSGIRSLVFVPENAAATKIDNMRRLGAEVRVGGDDCVVAEQRARAYAEEQGLAYISPYNDAEVIAGQGTVGFEILKQLPRVDVVFIALGGGGLASGVAGYLKAVAPGVHIVGCSPDQAPVLYECIKANAYLDIPSHPTLSDGTAGGLEVGSITLGLCRDLIDEHVLVSEDEIRNAMVLYMESHHQMIEGAAGTALAGMLKCAPRYQGAAAVAIICGANISLSKLKSVL